MSSNSNTKLNVSSCEELKLIIDKTLETICSVWIDVYGKNDSKKQSRVENIMSQYANLSYELIHQEEERRSTLLARIENSLQKKSKLEKVLRLNKKVESIRNDSDTPLVELDALLLNIIDEYKIIEESRLEKLTSLQVKETALCSFLDKPVQKLIMENGVVPSKEELEAFDIRIQQLEQEKASLINTFADTKAELAALLRELEVTALSKIERSVLSEEDEQFPVSKVNLEKLKEVNELYRQTKANKITEAEELRRELKTIWPRIKRDLQELENFLTEWSGYSKTDIDKLKLELNECKAIRTRCLKEVILSARKELEELWNKCCVSDAEMKQFYPYRADTFTEDILTLHDMEIYKLQSYYENYNQIFTLIDNRRTMWDRFSQLEELAKDSSRLFNNRGGQLLMEEKERKTIEKELPKLESKLKSRIKEFEEIEQRPFLYFGENLREVIQREWDDRNMRKESEKVARKIANLKTIETESKLGAKPTLSAKKRKLGASQSQLSRKMQKPNASTITQPKQKYGHNMVTRTPNHLRAVSTPDVSAISSIASYNTFQENLDPKTPQNAALLSTPASRKNAKTPSKTPTRTPMATRNRIPQFGNKF